MHAGGDPPPSEEDADRHESRLHVRSRCARCFRELRTIARDCTMSASPAPLTHGPAALQPAIPLCIGA